MKLQQKLVKDEIDHGFLKKPKARMRVKRMRFLSAQDIPSSTPIPVPAGRAGEPNSGLLRIQSINRSRKTILVEKEKAM